MGFTQHVPLPLMIAYDPSMDEPSVVTGKSAQPDAPVGMASALAAPWAGILRPQLGSARMASASRGVFALSFCTCLLMLAALVPTLAVWRATVRVEYVTDPGTTGSPSPVQRGRHWELKERTFAQVLRDGQEVGSLGYLGVLLFGTACASLVGVALMGWLHLPTVHRGGAVWISLKRSFRGAASCLGLVIVLVALLGSCGVLLHHRMDRDTVDMATGFLMEAEAITAMAIAVPACICLLLVWFGRAAAGARGAKVGEGLPPLCEECGYDLTHRPESGRCPECGGSVSWSLTPDGRRPGCRWQNKGQLADWIHSSTRAFVQPGSFYGSLKLRGPESDWTKAHRFALIHYATIGCGAGLWMLVCMILTEAPLDVVPMISVVMALCTVIAGWCVLHLAGALTATAAFLTRTLPDPTVARAVIAYETVFLWAFCLFNGLLFSSIMLFDVWLTSLLGRPTFNRFGLVAEQLLLLLGNAAIFITWLWRFSRAYRRVRWSNF